MDETTYLAYTHERRPADCAAAFTRRTGRPPVTAVTAPAERDAIAAALPAVTVQTVNHGGPHPGELWLQ